jgi:hypothetical protein
MKKFMSIVLGLVFAVSVFSAELISTPYISDAGKFTASFLVTPTNKILSTEAAITDASNNPITLHLVSSEISNDEVQLISYSDYSGGDLAVDNLEKAVTGCQKGIDGSTKATGRIEDKQVSTVQGLPSLNATVYSGNLVAYYQVVLSGNRLYQIMEIVSSNTDANKATAQTFLNSFKILR